MLSEQRRWTVVRVLSMAVCICSCASAPLLEPIPDGLARKAGELIGKIKISEVPITLDETEMDEAVKQFAAQTEHKGDGSESLRWACLVGQDGDGAWALWLEQFEMSGSKVGGFQWRRISDQDRLDPRCVKVTGTVDLPMPLRLGMSKPELVKVL